MARDYYEVLGVQQSADAAEIKAAFRKLAMEHHPDRNGGCENASGRFKELTEAYSILSDTDKRAAYDRFGHAAFENGGGQQAGGFDFGGGGLGDIFDQMFGQMGGRSRGPRGGNDIRAAVEIDLSQAFAGTKVQLRVPTRVSCEACNATGSETKDAKAVETCPTCQGAGKVRMQQGFFLVERTCVTCQGRGQTIRNPCRICQGAGTVQRRHSCLPVSGS